MSTRKIKDGKVDGEKIYFKGHAKATFMSDGRTVEDAIKQAGNGGGGSSSGGSSAMVIYDHGENDTTMTINPNTYHKWGEVGELTISLGEPVNIGVVNEYMFSFVNTILTPSLTIDELMWEHGEHPYFAFFAKNVVKIMDGHAKIESYPLAEVVLSDTYEYDSEEATMAQRFADAVYSKNDISGDYPVNNDAICVSYYHEYDETWIEDVVTTIRVGSFDDTGVYTFFTSKGHMFVLLKDGTIGLITYEI